MIARYFLIKKGRSTGVFHGTWEHIRLLVDGYSGASFRGFDTAAEVMAEIAITPFGELPPGAMEWYTAALRIKEKKEQELEDEIWVMTKVIPDIE